MGDEVQKFGGVAAENLPRSFIVEPVMEPYWVRFGHVEGIVRSEAELVGTMRPHQRIQLVTVEDERVEPDLP